MRDVDPETHFEYFRMYMEEFDEILDYVRNRITHPKTHRQPVSPEERLAITLRYVNVGRLLYWTSFS